MKVLICDDDPRAAQRISEVLLRKSKELGLPQNQTVVTDTKDFANLSLKSYDMAFLDVDMGDVNGIDLARKLRAAREDAIIIFVTNYIEYAPTGYEVQAFRYLLKPELDRQLPDILERAIDEYRKKHRVVSFTIESELIDVAVQNILYLESSRREIVMHLIHHDRTEFRFYSNMAQMEERLAPLGFLRIQKSYLVNMAYVELFQYGKVRLRGNVILPSSEKNHTELKRQYMAWRGQHKWSIC